MRIEKTFVGDVAILELRGEFDTFECSRFTEEIDRLETLGIHKVIVNFRFLRFINSTALGAIVKAKKTLSSKGGELAIAQPAKFVANVLDTLGLPEIIPVFGDEDEALDHFKAPSKTGVEILGENVILFHFCREDHTAAFGRAFGIAKIEEIEETRLRFKYDRATDKDEAPGIEPKVLFAPGNELRLKFRLPFYRKAYYFECKGRIKRTEIAAPSIRVTIEFEDLSGEDTRSIRQFVRDMRLIREEIKGSRPM